MVRPVRTIGVRGLYWSVLLTLILVQGQEYAAQVPAGLVAAFSFDDATGDVAVDLSGHGNAGTLTGATWVTGRFGTGLAFDGVDDWVTVADASSLDLTRGMTIEAWVYPTALSGWRSIVLKETANDLAYGLYGHANAPTPAGYVRTWEYQHAVTGTAPLRLDAWSHLALTSDGAFLRLYVNGIQVGSFPYSGNFVTSGRPLRIGGNAVWGEYFQGVIDEVRVYKRRLSVTEIRQDMETPVSTLDTTAPTVMATSPSTDAIGVPRTTSITAAFSENMSAASVTAESFELRDTAGGLVGGAVSYDPLTRTASLDPYLPLGYSTTYVATLHGGATGARVTDSAGNALAASFTWTFTTEPYVDMIPPLVVSSSPSDGSTGVPTDVNVTATFDEPLNPTTVTTATVQLRDGSGTPVIADVGYDAALSVVTLDPALPLTGMTTFTAVLKGGVTGVKDLAGNPLTGDVAWSFTTRASAPPVTATALKVTPRGASIAIGGSQQFMATAMLNDGSSVDVTASAVWTSSRDEVAAVAAGLARGTGPGLGTITASYSGLTAEGEIQVGEDRPLPPDPRWVAPPVNPTVATVLHRSSEFLYTGVDPIQTGVEPGTIEFRRAAVLRGHVFGRDNAALPDVTITIRNHPELGSTRSRADGAFDLVVNGGGMLTVQYEKPGYLTVVRGVDVPWQDFAWLPAVVMVQLDNRVTAVDLASAQPIQAAQANPVTDQDGTRQATLLFAQGTVATFVMPDGRTQPATSLSVRATEYTVGANGPRTMPAPLPPTSAYTYAVEYTIDEARVAGASEVRFSQPVITYTDNFLDFPIGEAVPSAYYDFGKGAWVPEPDGRVIKVLSETNGAADVDIDGTNVPASDAALAALGITIAERQQLAALYDAGKSLWRVPVSRFSPHDYNFPLNLPNDAESPGGGPHHSGDRDKECDPDCEEGSIVESQNQTLGESIPIAGTAFGLHYRSDRVPGRRSAYTVSGPLSDGEVPASVRRIEVTIRVAGQQHQQVYLPSDEQYTFTWDGNDAYGRRVQGSVRATVEIGYVYESAVYGSPVGGGRSFGQAGDGRLTVNRARAEITLTTVHNVMMGAWDVGASGGGWSLGVHHAYDADSRTVHFGDGSTRTANALKDLSIESIAGARPTGVPVSGRPAQEARFSNPENLTVGADGSLYLTENAGSHRIRPDGILETLAPASEGDVAAVGSDGSLYLVDWRDDAIRRRAPDGTMTIVAGIPGQTGFSGDGGPATAAKLNSPCSVAVAPDNTLYIADPGNARIRRVSPDGIITTFAGSGTFGTDGDGGPATAAQFEDVCSIALGPDGSVYTGDVADPRVRRITPDGIIRTVAGNGNWGFAGDGGPAVDAELDTVWRLAVAPNGTLYIADWSNRRIRRVNGEGIIATIAGNGSDDEFAPDGGSATAESIGGAPGGIAVSPDGNVYIASWGPGSFSSARVLAVRSSLPALAPSQLLIPSEDGAEIYIFDDSGRHLQTKHALTQGVLFSFRYDPDGFLETIADGDGSLTRIERLGTTPSAIVAPGGQRAELGVDGRGYLVRVTDPAGNAWHMGYQDDGLLTSFKTPNGSEYTLRYDEDGRLVRDSDPAGGSLSLDVSRTGRTTLTTFTTAEGRERSYSLEQRANGDVHRVNRDTDGTLTSITQQVNGSRRITTSDGSLMTLESGADPRWGSQAPFVSAMTLRLPSTLQMTMSATRDVGLSNPANPLSLEWQDDLITINGRVHERYFDALANQVYAWTPAGRLMTSKLDAQGRVTEWTDGALAPIQLQYDTLGRLTTITQGARQSSIEYDSKHRPALLRDPLSREVRLTYDEANRITSQTMPDNTTIGFQYDANGNRTVVRPAGRQGHAFGYTPVDLTGSYTPPAVPGAGPTQYLWNRDKQLTAIDRPDGLATGVTYDDGARLSKVAFSRGELQFNYDAAGRLERLSDPGGVNLTFAYDGSLPLSESWSGPVTGSVSRTFNVDFLVDGEQVSGAFPVTFGYDDDGLVTRAGDLALGRDPANGLVTETALEQTTDSFTYNEFGEPSRYTAWHAVDEVFDVRYTRDALGRITRRIEVIDGLTRVFEYTYDAAGRLQVIRRNGTLVVIYTYDENGNRIQAEGEQGLVTATYDEQDRLMTYGDRRYAFGANGELISRTVAGATTSYEYDTLGNLIRVVRPDGTIVTYTVDGRGRRVRKSIDGVAVQGWLYADQLRPIAELDGSGAIVSRFVYGSRSNIPEYLIKNGVTYRIFVDHVGSPRIVMNATTGEVAQRLDFDAFGGLIQDSSPGFQPFGFAGGLFDPSSGLVRFGARDYDPETGRWVSKDPIGFNGGEPNLYEYVGGDPLNWIDPSGHGKVGLFCKTVKGALKAVSRKGAKKALEKSTDVDVFGPGASKKARRLAREQWGDKTVRHDGHRPGQKPHYQHKNGGRGHVKYSMPGAALGVDVLGDNLLGKAVDFFNPLSDIQDLLDLFLNDEEEADEPEAEGGGSGSQTCGCK